MEKIVKKFAILPVWIYDEMRWLEYVSYTENFSIYDWEWKKSYFNN